MEGGGISYSLVQRGVGGMSVVKNKSGRESGGEMGEISKFLV